MPKPSRQIAWEDIKINDKEVDEELVEKKD